MNVFLKVVSSNAMHYKLLICELAVQSDAKNVFFVFIFVFLFFEKKLPIN